MIMFEDVDMVQAMVVNNPQACGCNVVYSELTSCKFVI